MSIIEYFFDVYCKYDFYKETKKIAPPTPLWRHITVFIIKMEEKPSIFTTKQQLTKGDSRKKTFLMKFFPARETSFPCVEKTIFQYGTIRGKGNGEWMRGKWMRMRWICGMLRWFALECKEQKMWIYAEVPLPNH
ncbi:hypothetical protein [Porphyromonas loveana]|uniref:hypothetical protein n=1 Tax=Porphyromonas loveana TaxID=1884669 RepID=UPI0035A024F5